MKINIEQFEKYFENSFFKHTAILANDGGTLGSSGIITDPKFCLFATS